MFDYEKYKRDKIKAIGLDPDKLTQDQIDLILEPIEAPENYHHDGEITPDQAQKIWQADLKKAGFTPLQVFNITKKILG